ncbi:MAG: carbohydrate kinase family protein [Oscillospiraceae bacterium]|nr:carbohydrate kinase family protein [Oscillospiraceae bacterium]
MFDIACVGIIVADVIAKPVDSLPEKGLLGQVGSIRLLNGGNAMTAAVNCSKLGLSSAMLGKIGGDAFGGFLKGVLSENKVNIDGLAVDKNAQTAASVALVGSDGERTFLHCVGADGTFSIDDVNWGIIEKSKLVFLTGSFLMDKFDGAQTVGFLKRCKETGKTTALDVCWDSRGRWGELLNHALPYVDIFLPSIDEARKLTGADALDEISERLIGAGVKTAVIKLGKNGCYIRENKNTPGYAVRACLEDIKPVDTTGAGDSFCSGFLTAYIKGMDLQDCARFANAAGAISVTRQGATTGIESYNQVYNLMKEDYL